jgi:hypothetical protein
MNRLKAKATNIIITQQRTTYSYLIASSATDASHVYCRKKVETIFPQEFEVLISSLMYGFLAGKSKKQSTFPKQFLVKSS